MKTPIYDFIKKYASSGTLRCHMPGHKGIAPEKCFEALFSGDITEISGADSLFEAEDIIAASEKNMASLYGTAATVYSAGGSTLCIQAMLAVMKQEKRKIFAVRNVHRSFLNAAALLDLDVEWIMPYYPGGILSGMICPNEVEKRLASCGRPACLYVTSPDYTGRLADIQGLSAICRRCGARLIVDNAHGAHLHFFKKSIHPIALGADMCCDSAHKMLPALTGAAMLHTARREYVSLLKPAMSLFASTSPSYPIMMSLDLCNKYIAGSIQKDIAENLAYLEDFRNSFAGKLEFADSEPFHITVKASESGYDGRELADLLRKNGAECEYADRELLILLMSAVCRNEDYSRLLQAMERTLADAGRYEKSSCRFSMKLPEKAMSIREAVFSTSEEIDVENSEGRICAAVRVPCPPAVPIAASGEIIDLECINIFKSYGISTVNVVK